MSDVDDLIKEIALKHHIAVSRDDPVMILQTINDRLIQDGTKAQKEIVDRLEERLEAMLMRFGEDAKMKAERIINAGVGVSRKMMEEGSQASITDVAEMVRKEVEAALGKIEGPVKSSRKVACLNIAAAVITLAGAFIVLWFR